MAAATPKSDPKPSQEQQDALDLADSKQKEASEASGELRTAFNLMDKTGTEDELLTPQEVVDGMKALMPDLTLKQAEEYVAAFDQDEDEKLDFSEFSDAAQFEEGQETVKERVDYMFRLADEDKDGEISLDEAKGLSERVKTEWTEEDTKQFLAAAGKDKTISKKEMIHLLEELEPDHGQEGEAEEEHGKEKHGDAYSVQKDIDAELDFQEVKHSAEHKEAGKDRKLAHVLKAEHLLQQFKVNNARLPMLSASSSSWSTPVGGGLIMIPLLVAAFGCRRRLRAPVASGQLEEVAEE